MDEEVVKQIEQLVKQNAELLQRSAAQATVIDELRDLVEDLTEAVRNLNLPSEGGFDLN